MNIKKGDTVEVIAGNHKGLRGEVQRVVRGKYKWGRNKGQHDANHDRVVVAGINLIKKHQRQVSGVQTQTGIIEREAPLHHSNVMVVCPHCDSPTRVGIDRSSGKKVRVCKACDTAIDR
ncbi:MAG: 50S ribosomal protein L24 [Anaerolineales bacterium]|nr:50S ribosomal protein L24 [Anaerolineales bacterium]MCB9127206.1 50S ribosomal protein L24 [Ardenticatenales bacterium]MCB9171962.1 50S ribosomal protein L24 [Ardenticatenales bacterium]